MGTYTVREFMTLAPRVVSSASTLAEAHRVMREHGIRHLPVVDAGRLVGVVSQRDLYLLETLDGIDLEAERVGEAMTPEPYACAPGAPLDQVALAMAERKLGSAVVVDRGAVIGLFTTVDALRALAGLVRRRRDRPEARAENRALPRAAAPAAPGAEPARRRTRA